MLLQDAGTAGFPTAQIHFLGLPTWIKAGRAGTDGRFSLIEQVIPAGFESPWHVHHSEDESFYVLEGEMQVIANAATRHLGRGDYAFGPRGVPHGFRIVGSGPARILLMTTGSDFADFVGEMGTDPQAAPTPPDFGLFAAAAERHNIKILGPIPS